jgi:GntR family transcriptional regulator
MTMIDYDAATPVYRQLADILRGRIEDGTYQPGRRLPSITGLVQEFGVAQLTARKALHLLVVDGLAETVDGKGTYVRAGEG